MKGSEPMKEITKKSYYYLVLILLAGIIIGFLIADFIVPVFYKSILDQKVKTLYELAFPGTQVEILSSKEESGLYKFDLKLTSTTGPFYQEFYVTKDGKLLDVSGSTINPIDIETFISDIEKSKNFVDCLFGKGLKIYGVLNQTANAQGAQATLIQLSLLGRFYSPKLYVSCDGDLVQQCLSSGINQVPSVVFNNQIEAGIKTIDWFENKTGCKLA